MLVTAYFKFMDVVEVGRVIIRYRPIWAEMMLYEVLYNSYEHLAVGKVHKEYVGDLKELMPQKY